MINNEKLASISLDTTPVVSGGGEVKQAKIMAVSNDSAKSYILERKILLKYLELMGKPSIYMQLPDGSRAVLSKNNHELGMEFLTRRALWRFIRNPNLAFGEEYTSGEIHIHGDLVEFLNSICRVRATHHQRGALHKYFFQGVIRRKRNTLAESKDNIHHHYDLGNEFYKLWLDKEMVYTCAYFPRPDASLEEAQFAKMEHICKKLRLKPGERVVEAGCGWGGLSRHMAKHYGVKVQAYNISHQQILEARKRAKEEGLDDLIEYIEDDYRNISSEFDVFVSVGMLEHVGRENYKKLGAVIDNYLTEDGRGLIHSIGQNEPGEMNAWFEKHIFPGSYPPTIREMTEIFEPYGFTIVDLENIRLHYAKTCEHWLARFNEHEQEIVAMYDEDFLRAFRLYLAGSVSNFETGGLQLFQAFFTRHRNNDIPWTRAYLYQDGAHDVIH